MKQREREGWIQPRTMQFHFIQLNECYEGAMSLQIFDKKLSFHWWHCFRSQPKIVEALLGYELIQVSCGASHVLAVTNEREVFAWGRGDNGIVNKPVFIFFFLVFACVVYDSCISKQSLMVGSLSERSPRAWHPGHPQLSTASVFTWRLRSPEGGVWSWLLHDYQQPAQHCGMWKQQVTILVLDSKVWQKWGSDEQRYITLRWHFHSMFSVKNANILSLYKLDHVGWWW